MSILPVALGSRRLRLRLNLPIDKCGILVAASFISREAG